jgi:shikimate 5-dehydrogenase
MTKRIIDLLNGGTLTVASQPPDNWRVIDTTSPYTIPLIAEDYPAKTAKMWNELYVKRDIPDRNSMMRADPKNVQEIIDVFRTDSQYRGGGAGIGFKEAVIPYLDEVTSLAKIMGAVNIIKKMPDGRLMGDNTDGAGFVKSLKDKFAEKVKPFSGSRVLLLGAGGSGRAIAFALAEKGVYLTILNRSAAKATLLALDINTHFGKIMAVAGGRELITKFLPEQDAVVSVLDDADSPLDEYSTLGEMETTVTPDSIKKNHDETIALLQNTHLTVVADIRIRKHMAPTLSIAHEMGIPILSGIPMVVNQGVAAFWWLYADVFKAKGLDIADIEESMWQAAL